MIIFLQQNFIGSQLFAARQFEELVHRLNSFGTDKQLIMYHIKSIFRRQYEFSCSSKNCPSRAGSSIKRLDTIDDMTLHPPNALNDCENSISKSINLWEHGTADASAIS